MDKKKIGLVVGIAVFAIGFSAVRFYSNRNADAEDVGPLCLAKLEDGRAVLVAVSGVAYRDPDSFKESEWRYQTFDLNSGERLGVQMIDRKRACGPAHAGFIWDLGRGSIALRSIPSLELVYDETQLAKKIPQLEAGLQRHPPPAVDPATGELRVHTSDGRIWTLDPQKLEARSPQDKKRRLLRLRGEARNRAPSLAGVAGQKYGFFKSEGARERLYPWGRSRPSGAPVSSEDFLEPELLFDHAKIEPEAIVANDRTFFVHQTSMNTSKAKRVISSWSKSGASWNAEGPFAELHGSYALKDTLIVVWSEPRVEVVALDMTTGAIKWSRHL